MSTSDDPPNRPGLTAAEFHAAFNRHTQGPLAAVDDELATLERSIRRHVPAAARFAAGVADGSLRGEALLNTFRPPAESVAQLAERVEQLERPLMNGRKAAGLAPRDYSPEVPGATDTAGIVHVAKRIIDAVWDLAYGWVFSSMEADDGADPLHAFDVLTWGTTADALRDLFQNHFAFPDPAPLLHYARMELAQLDGQVAAGAPLVMPSPVDVADDAPTVPMREAAQQTRKRKSKAKVEVEDEREPLPERPHPVEVKQPAANPVPVYIVPRPDGGPSAPLLLPNTASTPARPIIYSLGDSAYRVGDGESVSVKDNDDAVLQAFIGMPVMNSAVLIVRSGNDDAPRVLGRLRIKFKGLFAAAIECPGLPNEGGYKATVERATKDIL